MHAFEFGYAVGRVEKTAAPVADVMPNPVNFRLGGNLPAVVPGQGVKGAPVRDTIRQTFEAGKRLAGQVGGATKEVVGDIARPLGRAATTVAGDVARALPGGRQLAGVAGAAGLLGGAMGGVEGAGRGVGYSAGAGLGGGLGAGIGKSISRLLPQKYEAAAQLAGGALGTAGGLIGARKMMGSPSSAKQAGMMSDMAQGVKDKTKQMADKAQGAAKTVANKAVDAGKKMQTGFEAWRKGQAKAAFGPMPSKPVPGGGLTNAPRAPIGFVNGMPGTKQGPRLGAGTDALSKGLGVFQQGLDAVIKIPTMNTTVGTAGKI